MNRLILSIIYIAFACLGSHAAWAAPDKRTKPKKLQLRPTFSTLSRLPPPTSRPATRASTRKKPPVSRLSRPTQRSFKQKKPKTSPWLVRTRIPFGITLLGGLAAMVTGLALFNSESFAANLLLSTGTSVLFASLSSYMWWSPNLYLGMFGALLGITSLAGGLIITSGAISSLAPELGWGLLAATAVHLVLNLIGWLNLGKLLNSRRTSRHSATIARPRNSTEPPSILVVPTIHKQQAGLACRVSF